MFTHSHLQEAAEDVRTLARLCQLQVKMQSVDVGSSASAYEARIGRVAAVAEGIQQRLGKRLELLDGYARVMNMIEIEVEMDMQVRLMQSSCALSSQLCQCSAIQLCRSSFAGQLCAAWCSQGSS